ncbi:glycosyltransferase family 4 protein [Bacteroides sp.]
MNEPKIKLAYCIPGLYAPGGMERVLTLKANYLTEKLGYDVTIILTEEKERQPYYELSPLVKTVHLDINFDRMHQAGALKRIFKYPYYQHLYKKRLTRALNELRPDITISTLRREINFITSIGDGSRKIGELHFSRDNYRNFNDIKAPECIRKMAARLWMKQLLGKLKKLDKFVVLTNEDREKWTVLDNVICIHNPTTFAAPHTSDCEARRVIAVGRYTYQKGFDRLLPAWKIVSEKHPEWELVIYGDGEQADYQKQADELNLNRETCRLKGSTTQVAEEMAASSIFVLSSRYEGMAMVLGEAMSCGIPPVAFTCPCGPRDIITDGEDGLLVENGNIEQLAEKLNWLIENTNIRKLMGKNATVNVQRFNLEHIMQKWDALFKSIQS